MRDFVPVPEMGHIENLLFQSCGFKDDHGRLHARFEDDHERPFIPHPLRLSRRAHSLPESDERVTIACNTMSASPPPLTPCSQRSGG